MSSLPAGILQRGEEFEARLGAGQEGLQAPPSPKLQGSSNSGENNQQEKVSARRRLHEDRLHAFLSRRQC